MHRAGLIRAGRCAAAAWLVLGVGLPAPLPAAGPAQKVPAAVTADELILQFRRAELQAALRQAPQTPAARQAVQRALDALAQRHGVALHYLQTLGVGSARVAVTPASPQLDALVVRLGADAEVESVEVNARMTHFAPQKR
jgi:hypothetical protein